MRLVTNEKGKKGKNQTFTSKKDEVKLKGKEGERSMVRKGRETGKRNTSRKRKKSFRH